MVSIASDLSVVFSLQFLGVYPRKLLTLILFLYDIGKNVCIERLSMTFTANGKDETFAVSLQLCVQ